MQNLAKNSIVQSLEWITATLLFVMMALTFVDVVGRYLFSSPVYGAAEMIQFLLAATIFSAMGVVSARDGHIAVELFSPKLKSRFGQLHDVFVIGMAVLALGLIASRLAQIGIEALHTQKVTIVLEWPIAAIALPCAVLCALAAILQLLQLGGTK